MSDPTFARDLLLAHLRLLEHEHKERAVRWRSTARQYQKGEWGRAATELADLHDRMRAICAARVRELEGAPAPAPEAEEAQA